jgi:hypothetical protein
MRVTPIVLVCLLSNAIVFPTHTPGSAAEPQGNARLFWTPASGVTLSTQSPAVTLLLDRNQTADGPILLFPKEGLRQRLSSPTVARQSDREIILRYRVADPANKPIEVTRRITVSGTAREAELVEEFTLTPSATVTSDLEIQRPFALSGAAGRKEAVLPLYNGWARTFPLANAPLRGEYRLGNLMRDVPSQQLALPVVRLSAAGGWQAAISTDPFFGSLYDLSARSEVIGGAVRYRYAASRVPLAAGRKEVRYFSVWLSSPAEEQPQGAWLDAFFRLMLPDVPPGAKWSHEIAMVDYDFLSDDGQGWQRDVKELGRLLTPLERRHVALCYHGWYETIGGYSYDDAKKEMKDHWLGMGRTRKVPLSPGELRRQFKLARDLGFRVLVYFADGLLQDSAAPTGYRPEWDFVGEQGGKVGGWQGPDTWGTTYARNPSHPQVFQWYQDYLAALLKAFGPEIDGFVWDETMHMRQGMVTRQPAPAYCDQAMMRLVKALTAQVRAADPQKIFLTAECSGAPWMEKDVPSYAMVANGTYQDTGCSPVAWSYNLFPNWRNVYWGCNWASVSQFRNTHWGVEHYHAPVAVSNGWGDDRGPSEWSPAERDKMIALFRRRLTLGEPVTYLTEEPATMGLTLSDPIPTPAAGEVNWALAGRGAKAAASSVYDSGGGPWGPAGIIDGRRDKQDWGHGHGWASRRGQALPQWVEIQFPTPHDISRLVVITYHGDAPGDTAESWGVTDYHIQVWDEAAGGWKTVVEEDRARAMKTRVHPLEHPVRTTKFRIVITHVAADDSVARLLQLEAWGAK